MKAIQTLFPVFFMIVLGYFCKKRNVISLEQKDGIKKLIFNTLLPIVIFNALFTSTLKSSMFALVLYSFVGWVLAYIIGKLAKPWIGERFSKISPYMLMTSEGGSVVLPLYTSIVGTGYIINTVTFDMAGILIGFMLIPILVAKQSAKNANIKDLLINIFTNSFVIALIAGLLLNVCGCYNLLSICGLDSLYENTISMATASVASLILFCLGYEFHLDSFTMKPIIKLIILRIITSGAILTGFFFMFPNVVSDYAMKIAILIYFTCPTGFANALQVQPLFIDKTDESYLSTYTSIYMIFSMIAYSVIVMFVA